LRSFQKTFNPIDYGLLSFIFITLILKFHLIFKIKIGWDEFHYLSNVHTYLRSELTDIFQKFHVHFFSWLPAISNNEVFQVIAARICLFFLLTGTCICIYLIAKQILNRSGALFSVLCYLSLSNIIFHGASFRPDSICSFLFVFSLYHIIKKHRTAASFILSAIAMALSIMISIKAQFHLLAIGGVFVCLLLLSDNKKQTAVQILCFAVSFVIILFLLYFYHLSSLAEQPATGASEYLSRAGSKVIMLNKLFPGLPFFFFSVYENLIIWITFLIGIIVISWNGIRHKKWRYHGTPVFLLFPFLIPLLTLLFYRNAYPYYYVFIMAPAIIFCGVIMHHIAEDYKAAKTASYLFIAGIFSIGIFSNFLFHYSKVSAEQLTAQKEIIRTVHQIFPEPVPYLDGCSVISSFPKVGFFMSTWGMENYLQAGRPIMRRLLEKRQPLFLIVNLPSLDFSLPRENPFTDRNHALLEEDWKILNSNFIPHWGIIYVAGKKLVFSSEIVSLRFEILIPGTYTIETNGPVRINGIDYPPGSAVNFEQGFYSMEKLDPDIASVTLRWGKNLFRPEKEPDMIPTFYGF
jgi:hypothetical protein